MKGFSDVNAVCSLCNSYRWIIDNGWAGQSMCASTSLHPIIWSTNRSPTESSKTQCRLVSRELISPCLDHCHCANLLCSLSGYYMNMFMYFPVSKRPFCPSLRSKRM